MTAGQIILAVAAALVVFLYVKKFLLMRSVKQYSAASVKDKMKNGKDSILLDVRTNEERSSQSISGSIHIPLDELRNRKAELKKFKDKEIICYCRSGNRSLKAAALLRKDGFNTANLTGGLLKYKFNN